MKITLCGSRRFWREFVRCNRELSMLGHVVYTLGAFKATGEAETEMTQQQKETLDLVHLAKIEESDAILIINTQQSEEPPFTYDPNPYIGESTNKEIKWAAIRGKHKYWLSEKQDRIILFGYARS